MPVKKFLIRNGVFSEADIPASTGLWQTIYTDDANGDGFTISLRETGDIIPNYIPAKTDR